MRQIVGTILKKNILTVSAFFADITADLFIASQQLRRKEDPARLLFFARKSFRRPLLSRRERSTSELISLVALSSPFSWPNGLRVRVVTSVGMMLTEKILWARFQFCRKTPESEKIFLLFQSRLVRTILPRLMSLDFAGRDSTRFCATK